MSRVKRKLKARFEKGGQMPVAYNLYNQADVNNLSPAITATGNVCLDRVGTLLIFEESTMNRLGGDKDMGKLRIRKLTEGECYRLMGFEKKDTEACKAVGQSKATIYHQAGNSICVPVLVGIFGELFGLDYEKAINDYADKLHGEVI